MMRPFVMNALIAELVELAEGLPEVELAGLMEEAKRRRANLRIVPPDSPNKFSFIRIGTENGPLYRAVRERSLLRMKQVICDTGPIVAPIRSNETEHDICASFFQLPCPTV